LVALKVSGDLAIFTRPDTKIDRVSYPVMTPSAARGLLGTVYAKPEMHWEVYRIAVLHPIKFITMKCNEFTSFHPPKKGGPIFRTGERHTQRFSTYLRDPAYIIHAAIVCHLPGEAEKHKHWAIANRRIDKGQHYYQPCLGRKFCIAHFDRPGPEDTPITDTQDLGRMFFDRTYGDDNRPLWFDAKLENGTMEVPVELYKQVTFRGGLS
jgi:CRISPR-associated protein Cas5d